MLNFEYCSPTYFVFGKDTETRAGELVDDFGGSKVLLHFGGASAERSGLLDRVRDSLKAADIEYVELGGVVPNPRLDLVQRGIEMCREEDIDFILAVGGGSVIDSAKAIAVGVPYDGDVWDFFDDKADAEEALPVGTVLTLPATGSEASEASVITNTAEGKKHGYSSELIKPVFSIMNPELTYTLPPYQTACGVVDMLAHILERYLTNTEGVGLTDRLAEATMKTIIDYAPVVLVDPENYEARANIMWAGTVAHNDSLGLDREQDWSSHAIEHELSALYDVAHGAGLAVVFPAFMKYTLDKHVNRYAQLAQRVWNFDLNFNNPKETAIKGIAAFENFFRSIGMPTTFEELGAREDDIEYLAGHVRMKEDGKLGNFEPLDTEDIVEVYRLCLTKEQ